MPPVHCQVGPVRVITLASGAMNDCFFFLFLKNLEDCSVPLYDNSCKVK